MFAVKRQAHLVGLQQARSAVQHAHSEEPFALGVVDRSVVQVLDDALELLGGFVALQADHLRVAAIGIQVRDIVTAVVFGEAVQAIRHDKRVILLITCEHHLVRRQVAEAVLNAFVLERLPFLDRVDVKFSQAQSSSTLVRARFYTKKTIRPVS